MREQLEKIRANSTMNKENGCSKRKRFHFEKKYSFEDPYIQGHVVNHHFIFPAVLYLQIIDELVSECLHIDGTFHISNLIFCKELDTNKDSFILVTEYMQSTDDWSFQITRDKNTYCQGRIEKSIAEEIEKRFDLHAKKHQFDFRKEGKDFYQDLRRKGFDYKKIYTPLQYIQYNEREAIAFLSERGNDEGKTARIRPSIIEGGLQSAGFVMQMKEGEVFCLPAEIKHIDIYQAIPEECYVYVTVKQKVGKVNRAAVEYYNAEGILCAKIEDYIMLAVPGWKQENQSGRYDLEETDIAIIGMSGRLAQSEDLNDAWNKMIHHIDVVEQVPSERFDISKYYGDPHREENKTDCSWGSFLREINLFDNQFFKISREEARYMDPQVRMLLENVWRLLEDASYSSSELSNSKTGVYVGVSNNEYLEVIEKEKNNSFIMLGNNHSMVANKISAIFNLKGPSEPIDTLCSSSLVALYRAAADIRHGICEQAIVSGVNIILSPRLYITYSNAGMLSKTGRCHTFDKAADGFIRGEGILSLMLKPVKKAVEDKDFIYGIIKGGAIGHQGRSISVTSPLVNAQADTIFRAVKSSHIRPEQMSYIETHGTGTSLGDAVEINGLKRAFELLGAERQSYCQLGSVKSQIGHLESAAGIAGVMKVLLAMKNNVLPGNAHIKKLNPQIQLEGSPFLITKENKDWDRKIDETGCEMPRYAGISSFGAGGVNAHIVISDFKNEFVKVPVSDFYIFVLSAQTPHQLKEYANSIYEFMCNAPEYFENIIYTLQLHRDTMQARLVCTGKDQSEILHKLSDYLKDENCDCIQTVYDKSYNLWSEKCECSVAAKNLMDRDYDAVVKRYLEGMKIPWNLLYDGRKYSRVKLPLYPFRKQKLWFCDDKLPKAITYQKNSFLFVKEKYVKSELINQTGVKKKIAVFCENEKIAKEWSKVMRHHKLFIVLPKTSAGGAKKPYYYMNWKKKEDYDTLSASLFEKGNVVQDIIISAELFRNFDEIELVFCMHHLLCACAKKAGNLKISLYYLVSEEDNRGRLKDLAMESFFKSFGLENKNYKITMILADRIQRHKEDIRKEIESVQETFFQFVRYDKSGRSIKVLSEINLETKERYRIKKGQTYLITGGTGKIGLKLTNYLTQSCGANVIIIGRTQFNELQKENVSYYTGDVSDKEALRKIFSEIRNKNIDIHGVFHLAGITHDLRIEKKTPEMMKEVLYPKILGIQNLDILTSDMKLNFFVAFSSITAELGNAGQCDYAYANKYMDLFMEERKQLVDQEKRTGVSIAINWPHWKEGGMDTLEVIRKRLYRTTGLDSLETDLAIDILMRLMESDENNVTILAGDRQKMKEKFLTE